MEVPERNISIYKLSLPSVIKYAVFDHIIDAFMKILHLYVVSISEL